MPAEPRDLTPPEDALARILADAIVEDLLEAGGLWLAVRCHDPHDQQELIERLRAEGREVRAA
jgi:hypothetical protein